MCLLFPGVFVAILQPFISTFYIGLAGSVVLWVGLLSAVFAPDITWMTITFGFLQGTGMGIVMVTVIVAIMTHFHKYRGLAAGFKYTGNTLASLLLPKVLSSLQEVFSFRGTLLIYAALSMNATAFSLFLRDRDDQDSGTRSSDPSGKFLTTGHASSPKEIKSDDSLATSAENYEGSGPPAVAQAYGGVGDAHPKSIDGDLAACREASMAPTERNRLHDQDLRKVYPLIGSLSNVVTDENERSVKKRQSPESVLHAAKDAGDIAHRQLTTDNDKYNRGISQFSDKSSCPENSYGAISGVTDRANPGRRSALQRKPGSCTSDAVNLLAKPTFYVLVLGAIAADYTTLVVHGTIVDYALDKGVPQKTAEVSMTYCSTTELFGRLALPLVADLRFVGRTNLVATCFTAMAATSLALPHTTSFVSYILVQKDAPEYNEVFPPPPSAREGSQSAPRTWTAKHASDAILVCSVLNPRGHGRHSKGVLAPERLGKD
ncbi:hypothetical protein V5799_026904 [Amblyomma americanum]|uniref:Monocarboxylate transporter n=1 Tax=Amblyomma americanum TaxID=6943 RepID=A0AAQ4DH84_AMBAM